MSSRAEPTRRRRRPLPGPESLGLAAFVLLAVLPIAYGLLYAALYSVGLAGLLARGLTFAFWRRALGSGELWASFGLSLGVAAAVVASTVGLALFLALALRRRLASGTLSYLVYLPLALPGTVAAFVAFQWLTGAGLLTRLLLGAGLVTDPAALPALVQDRWGVGIVLTHTALATPFFTLLFAQIHDGERLDELTALAATLGASPRQALLRLQVPLLLRGAATNLALLFIVVLGSYEIPLLLGRQAPQMLSVLTLRKYQMFDIHQKPEAYAVALLYSAFVLATVFGLFRRRRPSHGG